MVLISAKADQVEGLLLSLLAFPPWPLRFSLQQFYAYTVFLFKVTFFLLIWLSLITNPDKDELNSFTKVKYSSLCFL